jgi:integrase
MTMSCYKLEKAARDLVSSVLILGKSKSELGALTSHVVTSIGTARNFQQCVRDFLKWRTAGGLSVSEPVTRIELEEYLRQECHRWRQKTVDQHRQALTLVFCVTLPSFDADVPTLTVGRACSEPQMKQIAAHQEPHNALGTNLAFYSGLRATDVIELREAHLLQPEENRPWRSDLFKGLPSNGVIYRTIGKGGLARSVWIPLELHLLLQSRRLNAPRAIVDRKVDRALHFDVSGGQKLSQSFSSSSIRTLGYSTGLHGCRYAYAQRRLETLLGMGVSPLDCLEIISQELGHLRLDISLVYTTKRK